MIENPVSRFWAGLSLAQKSITVGAFLLITNAAAFTITLGNIQERYQINSLEEAGTATAKAIRESSEFGIITRNWDILSTQIHGLLTGNVSSITILDNGGNILSEIAGSEPVLLDDMATRQKILSESPSSTERLFNQDGSLRAIIVSEMIESERRAAREEIGLFTEKAGKERIGTVIVVMNARQVYRELAESRKTFFYLGLLAIAVGISIIVIFVEFTAKPLKKLVIATQKVADGDLGYKVEIQTKDEIGTLASAFNIMLERLKDTQEKLVMTERLAASGRLAADVAHEINNPLAIMKNYIYLLRKKRMQEDDPNQQTLGIIDGEIDRISRIITQFTDFYRGSQIPLEEVDILDPLKEVIEFYRVKLEDNDILLEEHLTDFGKVLANRDKLKQVFLNLVKNAEEAIPDEGKIIIETSREDGRIYVSVTDTGMGIKAEDIGRVFDPFFTTKGVKGFGLGLSVTYGIIKNFGGDIEVQSEAGKGTTFKVMLPDIR